MDITNQDAEGNKNSQASPRTEVEISSDDDNKLRRAISIQAEEIKLLEKHASAPSAARLC